MHVRVLSIPCIVVPPVHAKDRERHVALKVVNNGCETSYEAPPYGQFAQSRLSAQSRVLVFPSCGGALHLYNLYKLLFRQHWPGNPVGKSALQPLIWCFRSLSFHISSALEDSFFHRNRYTFDSVHLHSDLGDFLAVAAANLKHILRFENVWEPIVADDS